LTDTSARANLVTLSYNHTNNRFTAEPGA